MKKDTPKLHLASDDPLVTVLVEGTSMFPVLVSGDRVLVKRSSIEDLNPGDIIVWSDETQKLIAHRVISIESSLSPSLIITRGDTCVGADPPVKMSQVLGKVVAVLRDQKVQWIKDIDRNHILSIQNDERNSKIPHSAYASSTRPQPSYKGMQVLDLRSISAESVSKIACVEDIGVVLLSPENAHAWTKVSTQAIGNVLTVPNDFRVYTGQPELLPDFLEFLHAPLRLVVIGQLFLTAFEPFQISEAIGELILRGQAFVSSAKAKENLESLTKIESGGIVVIPRDHVRWIGSSILGPEYLDRANNGNSLIALGELIISKRSNNITNQISLFHFGKKQ